MRNWFLAGCTLLLLINLSQLNIAQAQSSLEGTSTISSTEASKPISLEATNLTSAETTKPLSLESSTPISTEAVRSISGEAQIVSSTEAGKPVVTGSTLETTVGTSSEVLSPVEQPLEEGASYKGVPWGSDFNRFKEIKKYSGLLGSPSAAFINSTEDNNIALLLDVPISNKGKKNEQRVMFEFVPHQFTSVYYEPDDVYYIFYQGRLAMAYSRIAEKNFDIYRDNFYKKYTENESLAKQYAPSAKKSYRLDALTFSKGKTSAFLVRCQATENKKTSSSAKVLFVSTEFYDAICKEIKAKIADQKRPQSEKEQELLQKDLMKIE